MREILIPYIIALLCNRVVNWLDWYPKHREAGIFGYFKEYWPFLIKTSLAHVFLFPLWWGGYLLPLANGLIGIAAAGMAAAGTTFTLPPLEAVTPLTTLAAAWPLDSIGSRLIRYLKWTKPKVEAAP